MKKKPAAININLAPKDPFFDTAAGKILRWSLTVGRYIVIFTELVVIFSFGTRFTLDRQVTDLNDDISQKESIIKSYGDLEDQVRLAQLKIDQYNQIIQLTNLSDIFPILSRITPPDVKLEQLTVTQDGVTLSGTTLSQNSFNILINNLQLTPEFLAVSVDRIESNSDRNPGIHFQIKATTRAPQQKAASTTTVTPSKVLDRSADINETNGSAR